VSRRYRDLLATRAIASRREAEFRSGKAEGFEEALEMYDRLGDTEHPHGTPRQIRHSTQEPVFQLLKDAGPQGLTVVEIGQGLMRRGHECHRRTIQDVLDRGMERHVIARKHGRYCLIPASLPPPTTHARGSEIE